MSCACQGFQPTSPNLPLQLLFFLVYLDFLSVLKDIGMNRFLDQLASAAGDLQDEIIEGHAAEDVDVVR